MKINKMARGFLISLAMAAALLTVTYTTTRAQQGSANDQSSATTELQSTLDAKLDQVLANQKSIMNDIILIKEQLDVIRVRSSQNL